MVNQDQTVIVVEDVQKRFRQAVFAPVSFTLHAGQGLGIMGPNGAGKTTLLDIAAGLQRPEAGNLRVNGALGYVMQQDGLSPLLSCYDNLLAEAALCGLRGAAAKQRLRDCATLCGLDEYLGKRLAHCSAGMRQRVNLAAALLPQPALLLLDELCAPLDQDSHRQVLGLLLRFKQQGGAMLMVSHMRGDFAGLCEQTLILPEARLEANETGGC